MTASLFGFGRGLAMAGLLLALIAGLAAADKPKKGTYIVYDDKTFDFYPGGFMPDGKGTAVSLACTDKPYAGSKCIRIHYKVEDNAWVGIGFLLDNNFEPRRKFDLYKALGARKGDPIVLRLHVRSADGATAKFKIGGFNNDSQVFPVESPWRAHNDKWELVEIDVTDADLSSLHGALAVFLDREQNAALGKPVVRLDLDQIEFVKRDPGR
jgi:hypothetical protein